jgi:hypothetical protein
MPGVLVSVDRTSSRAPVATRSFGIILCCSPREAVPLVLSSASRILA